MPVIAKHNRNKTVLVIDPDASRRASTREILGGEQLGFLESETGSQALETIQAYPKEVSAVILDKELPDVDALELLRIIKAAELWGHVPVIVLMEKDGADDIVACVEAGAYYCMAKPCQERIFLSVLNKAITDFSRYKYFIDRTRKSQMVANLIRSGHFRYRTLKEGHEIADFLANLCASTRDDIVVGFIELLINAVEHGNLGIGYDTKSQMLKEGRYIERIVALLDEPAHKDKHVDVRFQRDDQALIVDIQDMGAGFDHKPFLTIDRKRLFSAHGRGIAMAKGLYFSTLEYLGNGNHVRATVRL